MDYCKNNIVGCSLIYGINILSPIFIGIFISKKYKHYKWAYKKIKEGHHLLDYTIDYLSYQNLPIFCKFIAVELGFIALFVASLIAICYWDSEFCYMEIFYLFIWASCGLMFYMDYRPFFKFSKELRTMLAILCIIQIASMIVFIIERTIDNNQKDDYFLSIEVTVYACNFIIMMLINIVSLFFPDFKYVKNYKIDQNIIQDIVEPIGAENIVYATTSHHFKKKNSFLEQLEEYQDQDVKEASMQQCNQSFLRKEDEILQLQKENEEIQNQIQSMHSQLDQKLNNLNQKDSSSIKYLQLLGPKIEKPQEAAQIPQEASPKQQIPNQQQTNGKNDNQSKNQTPKKKSYHISNIRVLGFQEIKKQRRRQIYYQIAYYTEINEKEVKTEHTLKDFQEFSQKLQMQFPDYTFPQLPTKKPNEKISVKDLKERQRQLSLFLEYIVEKQLISEEIDEFLKEIAQTQSIDQDQDDQYQTVDSVMDDNQYDQFIQNRSSSRKSLFDMKSDIDSQLENLSQQKAFNQNQQRFNVSEFQQDFKFIIRETKNKNNIIFYKIESEFGGVVTSSVERRYNDFRDLHRQLIDARIQPPQLPDEPTQNQDKVEYRRQALTNFINTVYEKKEAKIFQPFKEFLGI